MGGWWSRFCGWLRGSCRVQSPETPGLAARYPADCLHVFRHRPGLTGPVQVHLRDTDVVASQAHDEYASAPFGLPREQGLHWHRLAGTETRNVNGDDACMDRSAAPQRGEYRKACKNDD